MEPNYRILAINPGSTSTKVSVFENERELFTENISHSVEDLAQYKAIRDQYPFRMQTILDCLQKHGIAIESIDAFVGRGGGIEGFHGGTYRINDIMYETSAGDAGVQHPARLGIVLAKNFADRYGKRAYTVNGPGVDEMKAVARVTGINGVFRQSRFHALNQKEVAFCAAQELGKRYEEANFVVAHIGGGISVTAHYKGRCIDTTDIAGGDGPMSPTRIGQTPAVSLIEMCFSGAYTYEQVRSLLTRSGGITSLLGTSDMLEVHQRIREGDEKAKLVYTALIYQVGKSIGAYASALRGDVDAILLTGGMTRDTYLVDYLKRMCGYIAPIRVYPGEFEQKALAMGALRAMRGQIKTLEYDGKPAWGGFSIA